MTSFRALTGPVTAALALSLCAAASAADKTDAVRIEPTIHALLAPAGAKAGGVHKPGFVDAAPGPIVKTRYRVGAEGRIETWCETEHSTGSLRANGHWHDGTEDQR